MEFLKENKNIVIVILLIAIGYLLFKSETVRNMLIKLKAMWMGLSGTAKMVVGVIIVLLAYYLWTRESTY